MRRGMGRLIGVIQELSHARHLDRVRAIVGHAARELTGADGATFVLREGSQCFYADEDAIGPLWKGKRFPMSACISGWSMIHREAVVIPDIYADSRIPVDAYRPTFVKSLAMIPIRTKAPIGAIGNYWATPHTASEEEVALLQALADSVSIAIENATLDAELRAAKESAEAASRLKDQFLSNLSHELRTPLIPIIGWSELLAGESLSRDESKEAIAEILEAARQQARIVDDLLDVSRIVSGRLQLDLVETDPRNWVEAAVDSVSPLARVRGVRIERDWNDDVGRVRADTTRLRQIVWNLVSNATKFASKGGTVRVAVRRHDDSIDVAVRDDGVGIAPEFVPHVFDRFRQADGGLTRTIGGLGLGLALVKSLTDLHGWSIGVESEGLGRGATFTLSMRATSCLPQTAR